jgi:nitrite reductase (NADH) small subunit
MLPIRPTIYDSDMSDFVKICSAADLPLEGNVKEIIAPNGRPLCLARVKGEVTAMDNECPHNGGPLGEGMIEEDKVICPWHGWAFDRHTGAAEHDSSAIVEVITIKIEGDDVLAAV